MESIAQWFRPQPVQQFVGATRWEQVHRSEPAGIVECDPCAVIHVQDNMVVFFRYRVVMHELTQRIPAHGHAARHAEVDQQDFIPVKLRQHVF